MIQLAPISVVATHRITNGHALGPSIYSMGNGNFDDVYKAADIYYKAQPRYRKCALILVLVAIKNGMEPVKFVYHRNKRVGTLHVLNRQAVTPDGKPWPAALNLKEE